MSQLTLLQYFCLNILSFCLYKILHGSACRPVYDIFSLQVHFRKFVILGILDVTIYYM